MITSHYYIAGTWQDIKNWGLRTVYNKYGEHWMKYVCTCGGYILERMYYEMKEMLKKTVVHTVHELNEKPMYY
jgi:hypothetical protein